jgi:hypothetical protein
MLVSIVLRRRWRLAGIRKVEQDGTGTEEEVPENNKPHLFD